MNPEHLNTYTTDDFILDEGFRKIIQHTDSNDKLDDLLTAFPEKKNEIDLATQILKGLKPGEFHQEESRQQELWQQILHQQKKQVRRLYFSYAASILLLLGLGSIAFYLATQKKDESIVSIDSATSGDAMLILANGKKVPINSKQSTVQYSSDGSAIKVNGSSEIAQASSGKGYNQLIVPYGKRSYVVLSEGTKVWLNSGSKLIFPPVFKGKTREVMLEGEAFFDVTKNNQMPFLVKTEAFKVKVFGTKFNVQAYSQEKEYNVVLVEGKVSMNSTQETHSQEIFLAPHQKASILNSQKGIEVTSVENTEIYTAWMDGYLTFINEDVAVLLKRVSRYYDVDIEARLPKNTEKIYGKLDLKEDLERVLEGIAFISKTRYIKQGNKYIFKNN